MACHRPAQPQESPRRSLTLAALLLGGWIPSALFSAPAPAGKWTGQLKTSPYLQVGFEIQANREGGFRAALDSPMQGALGIPAGDLTLEGDRIPIEAKDLGAACDGRLQPDGESLLGTFLQGKGIALDLRRVDRIEPARRPQTPGQPCPYRCEEVSYPGPR